MCNMNMNTSSGSGQKHPPVVDGILAWIVAVGAFIVASLVFGTINSLGLLLTEIREEFSTDTWVIGLSVSLGQVLGGILCKCNYFIFLFVYRSLYFVSSRERP